MAITYSAGAGTTITTHAMNETLATQAQQTGNNTVVVTDTIVNVGNGQLGDGTTGIGDTYKGRLVIIDFGLSTEQRRFCTLDSAGTGTTRILTVHEDWDINPVITTDTIHVPYEMADIEDGTASGGIGYTTRTGYFTLSNDLTIASTGGLQMMNGTAAELDDSGSSATFFIQSGGYFYSGYEGGGGHINGGLLLAVNNVTGEPFMQCQSGSMGYVYDMLFWGQLVDMGWEHADGAGLKTYGCKWLNNTNELTLYDHDITDGKIYGKGATTSIVRVDAGTIVSGAVISTVHALDSIANTTIETLQNLEGVIFSGTTNTLSVRQNKTWYLIDPVWDIITYTDLDWIGTATGNSVFDQRSITATVQKADGTLLQDSIVNIYENTQLDVLVLELTTDIYGYAKDAFTYKKHETNSLTTTYGGHALQSGKWLYLPFVAAQVSDEKFLGTIVLSPDNDINQTVQATALSAGSTITWNEDTNTSELFDFTLGSGTLADGMILTFSPSGAVGTITKSVSGDSISGEIHLKDRDVTAIANSDTFSRTGGTAGTFSGTYTNDSKQPFSIWVDGQNLGLQVIYDYFAALTTETTLSATGKSIWEWCRSAQSQSLYSTGSSFYTEQSNSKGVIIVDSGAGTFDYATDDNGNTWVPPVSISITFDSMRDNSEVRVYEAGTNTEIAGIENATSGTVDDRSFTWSSNAGTIVDYVIHNWNGVAPFYQTIRKESVTVPSSNTTISIAQQIDRNAE